MKNPTALRHVSTVGNMDASKAVAMGIDEDGMVVLMSMLSNLYSNGNEAVVREYSCNARDSHVEARQARPVEVTLPTMLDPQFKVQDWGIGLSHDEILKTFAMYGASTKRDSNSQIGAFGIGAKSAFTVGNQFTVTGVKDGEKTLAMFSLNASGVPTVQILHRGETDEPNGVLIDVGVENVDAIRAAAYKLFVCWKPGTILVDGREPVSMWANVEPLADRVYIDWNSSASRYDVDSHFKLVMGGVPYAFPRALWTELNDKAQAFLEQTKSTSITYVLDVPIGSVDITPSREELRVTPRTKATVGRLLELTINSMQAWITARLNGAANLWEASRVYVELTTKLNYKVDSTQVYWNGVPLGESTITLDLPTFVLERSRGYSSDPYRNNRIIAGDQWFALITQSSNDSTLFVSNVPDDKVATVRTYAKSVLMDTGKKYLVAMPGPSFAKDWFSVGDHADTGIKPIDFKDFWAMGKALRKSRRGSSKNRTQYITRLKGETTNTLRNVDDIVDLDAKLHLVTTSRSLFFSTGSVEAVIWNSLDAVLIKLTGTQKREVLDRSIPGTQDMATVFKAEAAKLVAKFTKKDHRILAANAARSETSLAGIKFIRQHRSEITNTKIIDYVDNYTAKSALSQDDLVRLKYLESAYYAAGMDNPYDDVQKGTDYLLDTVPLLLFTLDYSYQANRFLPGGEPAMIKTLIDYINTAA